MKTYIQIKDGIGFAFVDTAGETTGIEVPYGTGEEYLNKTYENDTWGDTAPLIWFAELGYDGSIIEIRKTRFISDIGLNPILTPDIDLSSKWINGEWVKPVTIIEQTQQALDAPATEGSLDETAQTISDNTGDTV